MGSDPENYRIEPLSKQHNRSGFNSGSEPLDRFLSQQAGQEQRKAFAGVFVAVGVDSGVVAGFYTLSSICLVAEELSSETLKRLPRYPQLPATLIGRLAVSLDHRGKGLGTALLYSAIEKAYRSSETIGSAFVVVDAKDDSARRFYERHQFIRIPSNPHRLFIPMKLVAALVGK